MKKITVGIFFGGRSAEHEVSLQSAKNVIAAIDKEKYEVVLIGINKEGRWFLSEQSTALLNENNPTLIKLNTASAQEFALSTRPENQSVQNNLDVIFPILHGPLGEDGTLQGMLRIADLPFVGCDVLSSAVCMDKDFTKRLLKEAGLPVAKSITLQDPHDHSFTEITEILGDTVFIKPANMGSSVGVSKVRTEEEFAAALTEAFRYDTKVLVEEAIAGRELECGILGNENPQASIIGEVIPSHEFYSYDAKYIDESGAALQIPAQISEEKTKEIQALAIKAFKTLGCSGLARVDFFLQENGRLIINEINTMPGFTKISMYPKLWGASGITYSDLIDRLITLAFEKHSQRR